MFQYLDLPHQVDWQSVFFLLMARQSLNPYNCDLALKKKNILFQT